MKKLSHIAATQVWFQNISLATVLTFVLGDILLDAHHLHVHHNRAGHRVLPLDEDVLAVVATSHFAMLQRFSSSGFNQSGLTTHIRAVVVWSIPWVTVILGRYLMRVAPVNQMIRERRPGANVQDGLSLPPEFGLPGHHDEGCREARGGVRKGS